jgi:type IV secretory pathway VirB10-like protein
MNIRSTLLRWRAIAVCLLLAVAGHAAADEVVFYRCTDAAGSLTVQNMPCPKDQKQEKRTMQGISTVPMAPASAPPRTPAPAAPASRTTAATPASTPALPALPARDPDAPRLPPPIVYQCTTYDKDTFITEDSVPASRCVPLRTTGLDGNPQAGAGQACEVVKDTCARVADGALCDAWKKRRDETEVAFRFSRPENLDKHRAEFERVARIVSESTCGAP